MLKLEAVSASVYVSILASLVTAYWATVCWNSVKKHRFWYNQGIRGQWLPPYWGPIMKIFTQDRMEAELKLGEKYGRIYTETNLNGDPRLIIADPEVIKQVLIKDFDNFIDRVSYPYPNKYQEQFLMWLKGNRWRRVRSLMSPSFTSTKIKRMFNLLSACADDLVENFREQLGNGMKLVNLQEVYSSYTLAGILICSYGIRLNREKGNSDARGKVSVLVKDAMRVTMTSIWHIVCTLALPKFFLNAINFNLNPEAEFEPFIRRIEEVVKRRQQQPKSAQRQDDLLQMLIDTRINDQMEHDELDQVENHHANLTHESIVSGQRLLVDSVNKETLDLSEKVKLSNMEMLCQAVMILLGGMDTTKILLSNCSYSLAYHPHVQDKLVEELRKIAKVSQGPRGPQYDFTYEDVTSCQYLDAVISETLRILPPFLRVHRAASEDYIIEKYNLLVPAGAQVFAGSYVVQNSPEFWQNPREFNPERFMPENRDKIVSGSYLPFGLGAKYCIGMRFGLTEVKIGLAKTVMNFRFEPAPGLEFPPKAAVQIKTNSMKDPYTMVAPRY